MHVPLTLPTSSETTSKSATSGIARTRLTVGNVVSGTVLSASHLELDVDLENGTLES